MVALGRPAAGERFDAGHCQAHLDIRRDGQLIWHERQRIAGGDGLLDSPIGLDGHSVFATLIVSGEIDAELMERCRELPSRVRGDLTQLPRSEEHTSELQSLMRIWYASFCLTKKKLTTQEPYVRHTT